ncbi:uncharacterized protein PRCAT00000646001 [Priceomyces carsonii]|uniref:uncharacterized protein n=1 Tax=Priceomyces carsonii TaxID=28549 RepID=UPI002ED84680|nr:unnamed protein product [Priceomyces carsonii]
MLFSQLAVSITLATAVFAAPMNKRGGNTCSFPSNDGMVLITPKSDNAGWAMSPDQKCTSGNYCPYACPPGKLMAQWDKSAKSYTYPESQNGGLYCNDDGTVSKPFSNKGYCVDGEGTVLASNSAGGGNVAFCQTVLPGNEAMLIPTSVGSGLTTLAVPGPDYFASTAAHYYINAPGISTSDACSWGTSSKPQGNWAPYVAGANVDDSGKTFVKIGWNPKHIDDFSGQKPDFGVRVTCENESDCNGLDCELNPKNGYNSVKGSSGDKQEGASFCVVTVNKGSKANIEVFDV